MDAMVHSPELLARLRTFKEGGPGRQVLAYVLAQMGIPIQQVRLLYLLDKVVHGLQLSSRSSTCIFALLFESVHGFEVLQILVVYTEPGPSFTVLVALVSQMLYIL
jgi:hypothetical protein